jgi:hypothetical protein
MHERIEVCPFGFVKVSIGRGVMNSVTRRNADRSVHPFFNYPLDYFFSHDDQNERDELGVACMFYSTRIIQYSSVPHSDNLLYFY